MGVPALFTGRYDRKREMTVYRSRVTGREYLFERVRGFIGVYVYRKNDAPWLSDGRCIYRGRTPENAFGMMELDDCI